MHAVTETLAAQVAALNRQKAALVDALENLLVAEKLDDDDALLIAAREQASAALDMARREV